MLISLTECLCSQEVPDDYTTIWGYGYIELYDEMEITANMFELELAKHHYDVLPGIPAYELFSNLKINMQDPKSTFFDLACRVDQIVNDWIKNGQKKRTQQATAPSAPEERQVEEKACFETTEGETLPTEGTTKDAPECDIVCPCCGQSDPYAGDVDIETNRVYVDYECDNCGSSWKCAFDLTGYKDFEVGSLLLDE
jgi:hypothetical protein